MPSRQELLDSAEMLKNLMVARATGDQFVRADEYQELRAVLVGRPELRDVLPRFVRTCRTVPEFWSHIQPMFETYRGRRAFLQEEFEPLLAFLEEVGTSPGDEALSETFQRVDAAFVRDAWYRALERRAGDPAGAVTAARTLLETTLKHILDEASVPYEENWDLPRLYRATVDEMHLSPGQQVDDVLRRILGSCQSIVEGLGALRNRVGDAHGIGASGRRALSREAELAVNLAGTMAMFLVESWEAWKAEN